MYKILIVDDEKMIREGIKRGIDWGKLHIEEVMIASSGREAYELVMQKKPDILLTDINMAHMNGLELIEQSLKVDNSLKVIVLTGYDSFEYARKALRLKVQDFLLKPIDEDVLTESIKRQIAWLEEETIRKRMEKEKQRIVGLREQVMFEKHIRDLLHNRDMTECKKYLQENYRRICKEQMAVAVLTLPLGVEKEEEAGMVICRQILGFSASLIDDKGMGVTILDDDGVSMVVILYVERCGSDGVDVIRELSGMIKNEIGQSLGTAIGNVVSDYSCLSKSYQEALYLLESQQEQIPDILLSQSIKNRNRMFQEVFDKLCMQMCHNISNKAYLMKLFESFQNALITYNLSDAYSRRCCYRLITSLYFSIMEAGATRPEQSLDSFVQSLSGSSRKTACEMTQHYLIKMFNKDEEVHDIVSKAKYYVNQHLSEELSVSSLAETQYVSPNYFSRLFKRVTGEGCNEYIVRKRMEKACTLLNTTNFNTGKIAKMVGYNDSNYFSITFKKHFGMSPTFYRNQEGKKE